MSLRPRWLMLKLLYLTALVFSLFSSFVEAHAPDAYGPSVLSVGGVR